uniref:Putative secreted peptide n=1 Tax=Anopheles braziliensis TaxID=58242 RepID=A0A2M3ZS23_9DIPT
MALVPSSSVIAGWLVGWLATNSTHLREPEHDAQSFVKMGTRPRPRVGAPINSIRNQSFRNGLEEQNFRFISPTITHGVRLVS